MTPKISVLIPLYNRRRYIEEAINSALIQTFQDFEIIVRDDASTDGSFEFVRQRYAAEISSGKLKLRRNEKNLGEFPTDNRLLREAAGKYVMLLHSDDLYLLNALEQLYDAAEYFNADVVHAGTFLESPAGGVIDENTPLKVMCWENRVVKNFEVVPNEAQLRFDEWCNGDTFIDAPYNIFRRQFLLDNEIFFPEYGGNFLFCLHWLMKAKTYVKTPDIFYVHRDAPDSQTNDKTALAEKTRKIIFRMVGLLEYFDKIFGSVDFFKGNEAAQYRAKAIFYRRFDGFEIHRLNVYERGITPELHRAVDSAIKECFGARADYVTFLFHAVHCLNFDRDYTKIVGTRD